MSYILDALKKSEQQRGHGEVPDVQTIHSSSLNYRNEKKPYWPYILITVVTFNLIAIVYFIFSNDPTATTAQVSDTQKSAVVINQNTVKATPPENKKTAVNRGSAEKKITPIAEIKKTTAPVIIDKPEQIPASHTIPVENVIEAKSNIVEFYELPESMQLRIPSIVISAHIYSSNPLQRSIVVNNQFLEEGDYVIDQLILDEITSNGAIFDFEGTRFSYGVVSGWQ